MNRLFVVALAMGVMACAMAAEPSAKDPIAAKLDSAIEYHATRASESYTVRGQYHSGMCESLARARLIHHCTRLLAKMEARLDSGSDVTALDRNTLLELVKLMAAVREAPAEKTVE